MRHMLERMKPFLIGFLGAGAGTLIVLGAMHLLEDHQAFHQALAFLNANAARIAALPK